MKKNIFVLFLISCIVACTPTDLKSDLPAVPEHVLKQAESTALSDLLWTEYPDKLDRNSEITVSQGLRLHHFDEQLLISHGNSLDYRKYADSKEKEDYIFSFVQKDEGIMLFVIRNDGDQADVVNAGGYGRQFVQVLSLINRLSEKAETELYQYFISGKYVAFVHEGNRRYAIVFDASDSDLDSRYLEISRLSELPQAEKFMKKYLEDIDMFTELQKQAYQQYGEDGLLFGDFETYDLFD